MVETKSVELFYAVHLKKRTAKEIKRTFIIVKNRRDEFKKEAFHGIGYWHIGDLEDYVQTEIEEVWIPWENIDYIKSLVYKPR